SMPRRKFKSDFPHVVEMVVPEGGLRNRRGAMLDFHIRHGIKPHPGVNEWQSCRDAPWFTNRLQKQFAVASEAVVDKIDWLPVVRLAKAVNRRLFTQANMQITHANMQTNECYRTPERSIEAAVQYEQNIKIAHVVSKLYNVKALFFLQPDARYNYPMELYRNKTLANNFIKPFHRYNEMFYSKSRNIEGVIDLTNLFELWGHDRKAIIDQLHYSPKFNQFLAQHVADQIDLGSLVKNGRLP